MINQKRTKPSQSLLRFVILFLVALVFATTVAWLNQYIFIMMFSLGLGISIWFFWEQRINKQIEESQHNSKIIESYKQTISELQQKTNQEKENYDKSLEKFECQLLEAKHQNDSQIAEIELYKRTVSDLNQEIQIFQQSFEHNYQIIESHKKTISDLGQKIKKEKEDCDKKLKNFECQLVEAKNHDDAYIMETESYKKTIADLTERLNNPRSLSKEMLCVLLPNIEFLRDSIKILYEDLDDPLRVMKQIKSIDLGNAVGKGIRATGNKWFENRVEGNGDWRIYFRKDSQQAKLKIYISHKKSQEKDFDWLKQQ